MLTNKGLGCLLLIFKLHKSLLLSVDLIELGVDHAAVLLHVGHHLILCDLMWQGREVDHFCGGAAVPVVLYGVVVEPIQARVCVLVCVGCGSYVWVFGEIHLHFLPKEHRTLF